MIGPSPKNPVVISSKRSRARPKVNYAGHASAIEAARTQKMREIDSFRAANRDARSFAGKAQTLLTRDWSKASWRARESILRTVAWLLRMEKVVCIRVSGPDRDYTDGKMQ